MAKKKNTGVAYEKLVQGIFQAIHDQEEVATVTVEQNKILQGKISTHQIDVYWKFQKAGIEHEVVVQAKDWRSAVKQGNLFHFKCVLDDLPSQPRGVFVTRTGYQQGAKQFADEQGIDLYELDEPPPKKNISITTLGWCKFTAEFRTFKVPAPDPSGGTVDQLAMGLKATIFEPRYSTFAIQIDSTWLSTNPDTAHIDKSSLSLRPLPVLEVKLYDQNRLAIGNMEAIVRQELDLMKSEKLDQKHIEHTFDTPTFLGPESTGDLFLKINRVTFDLEIVVTERPPHFNLPGFVKLVLRKIPSQKEQHFITREQ
jgi:Restriction endonuclease